MATAATASATVQASRPSAAAGRAGPPDLGSRRARYRMTGKATVLAAVSKATAASREMAARTQPTLPQGQPPGRRLPADGPSSHQRNSRRLLFGSSESGGDG